MEREFGIRPGIMRGDTTMNDREKMIREFRADAIPGEPRSQVLLLSVFCGAVGLNLPEARWVVHVERVWNPALELQATCRVHRLTSQHPVKAYCLFTEAIWIPLRRGSVLCFPPSSSWALSGLPCASPTATSAAMRTRPGSSASV
ncbi:unnamed protein product [Polarella glacialis]|uniref:Helicase C-terminal domain-containing protein n=1 Tax=Polarella glacialis TaxID=89957 RepID=A0A813G6S2_POLGL|nr:unnamed protein product [Polarella glacialis]